MYELEQGVLIYFKTNSINYLIILIYFVKMIKISDNLEKFNDKNMIYHIQGWN